MRVVSSVTRILVYIVIIILGVLALAAPYALEYYEFGASTQSDLEAISIAMGSEFFTHALLPVGLFGCLSNIVALVFLSGKRKDKRYGKFVGETLAGIVVNIGRFIMALTVAIFYRTELQRRRCFPLFHPHAFDPCDVGQFFCCRRGFYSEASRERRESGSRRDGAAQSGACGDRCSREP